MSITREEMLKIARYVKGALRGFPPDAIMSEATHQVTGRGTIKQCRTIDGPFWVGRPVVIDGLRWTVAGIETTSPAGASVGLIVKPRSA